MNFKFLTVFEIYKIKLVKVSKAFFSLKEFIKAILKAATGQVMNEKKNLQNSRNQARKKGHNFV